MSRSCFSQVSLKQVSTWLEREKDKAWFLLIIFISVYAFPGFNHMYCKNAETITMQSHGVWGELFVVCMMDLMHTRQELPLRHMSAPSHPYCVHLRWQLCCGGAFKFYWSVFLYYVSGFPVIDFCLYWLCWWSPCYWFVFILITLVVFPVSICSLYIVLGFSSFLQAVPTQPVNFSIPSVSYSSLRHVQPAAYGHLHSGIGLSTAQPKTVNLLKMCLVFVCFCSWLSHSYMWAV